MPHDGLQFWQTAAQQLGLGHLLQPIGDLEQRVVQIGADWECQGNGAAAIRARALHPEEPLE